MTIEQMKFFMDRTGITEKSWVRLSKLASINFDTDGNEHIKDTSMYFFDTDNGLIKIREYFYLKDVGKTYILKRVSSLDADRYIDIENIASFTIGNPIKTRPDPLTSYLYKTELGL